MIYTPRNSGGSVKSFKVMEIPDGTLVGLFQGNRGDRRDLDFIVKFLLAGQTKRIRTPENMHWVTDMLIKREHYPEMVKNFIRFYVEFYYSCKPFKSIAQRNNYKPRTLTYITRKFPNLTHEGTMHIAFIGLLIELFSINELQSPRTNKMFERLLVSFDKYCDGEIDYFQLISRAKPGF